MRMPLLSAEGNPRNNHSKSSCAGARDGIIPVRNPTTARRLLACFNPNLVGFGIVSILDSMEKDHSSRVMSAAGVFVATGKDPEDAK